ncbi:hypothetical protein Bca101_062601 [Brassica carinata]
MAAFKKKKSHNISLFACCHAPPTALSPYLPWFGRSSPSVRPLRVTDSPFPLREDGDVTNGHVDKAADEFIKKFYKNLNQQKKMIENSSGLSPLRIALDLLFINLLNSFFTCNASSSMAAVNDLNLLAETKMLFINQVRKEIKHLETNKPIYTNRKIPGISAIVSELFPVIVYQTLNRVFGGDR